MDNINTDKVNDEQPHEGQYCLWDWCVVSGRDRWSARLAPGLRLLVCDGQT